jgi:hypothetical protein
MANKLKTRSELYPYFVKNAIPTEGNFRDLIDSQLNQSDDGVFKPANEPLSVVADSGPQKRVLRFYSSYSAATPPNPDWLISLNPAQNPTDAATNRPGFGIADGAGNTRLFIQPSTGHLGVGTNTPADKLTVQDGDVRIEGGRYRRLKIVSDKYWAGIELVTREQGEAGNPHIDFTHGQLDAPNYGIRVAATNNTTLNIAAGEGAAVLEVAGNVTYSGTQNKLDVAEQAAANVRVADFKLGHSGRRGSTGRALVDNASALVLNYGTDWPRAEIHSPLGVNGNLGSNTVNPEFPLDIRVPAGAGGWNRFVVNTTTAWGDGTTQYVTIGAGGAAGIMFWNPHVPWYATENRASIRYGRSGGVAQGAWWDVGVRAGNAFSFTYNGITDHRLWLDPNGNIGIGTAGATPSNKLTVRDGDIAIEGGYYRRLKIVSDQYWAGIELVTRQVGQDAHPHIDFTHGELDNPNFGLRLVATDNSTLVLQAGSGGANLAVSGAIVPSAGGAVTNGIVFPADPFGGGGDRAWIRYHNARGGEKTTLEIGVSNDGDDHIVLNASGNVGIGVTDPTSKLDVAGAYIAVRGLGGEHGYIGGDGAGNDVQVGSLAAGVTNIAMYNPTYGYMFLYARQYQNASDARLKKDIEPITGGLEKLLKLRSVSFQWKVTDPNDADRRSLGLVAQEVREVLPDAVMEGRDGMLTIDYNAILAMAVEGLKEQQSQIAELRNGLKAAQARLDKLAAPKKTREPQS